MVKRVLFFRPTLGVGGADRVTLTVLRHLDRARFEPILVLMRAEGPFLADLPPDVRVISLDAPRLARSGPGLYRVLRAERPDILFSTCSTSNVIAGAVHAAARSRAGLVMSERSTLYRGRSARHIKQTVEVALKRIIYPRADLITAVSQGVADELHETLRLPREKIQVVYNPMVEDDIGARAAEPVDHPWFHDGLPVVIAVGRLVPQKDYPTLLEAFARVRRRVPARLFVLGEGFLREPLAALTRAKHLDDAVHFAGFDKNPFKYMARAQLLMQSSSTEGLPGSLIQSMACGTPVVATDCDFGPREVITASGEDGFLVPVGDADRLADRAIDLLEDAGLRAAVATRARLSIERFTVPASMARYQGALEAAA
jgi:glycosyltransferase involved in cell wall biosynthesis